MSNDGVNTRGPSHKRGISDGKPRLTVGRESLSESGNPWSRMPWVFADQVEYVNGLVSVDPMLEELEDYDDLIPMRPTRRPSINEWDCADQGVPAHLAIGNFGTVTPEDVDTDTCDRCSHDTQLHKARTGCTFRRGTKKCPCSLDQHGQERD